MTRPPCVLLTPGSARVARSLTYPPVATSAATSAVTSSHASRAIAMRRSKRRGTQERRSCPFEPRRERALAVGCPSPGPTEQLSRTVSAETGYVGDGSSLRSGVAAVSHAVFLAGGAGRSPSSPPSTPASPIRATASQGAAHHDGTPVFILSFRLSFRPLEVLPVRMACNDRPGGSCFGPDHPQHTMYFVAMGVSGGRPRSRSKGCSRHRGQVCSGRKELEGVRGERDSRAVMVCSRRRGSGRDVSGARRSSMSRSCGGWRGFGLSARRSCRCALV